MTLKRTFVVLQISVWLNGCASSDIGLACDAIGSGLAGTACRGAQVATLVVDSSKLAVELGRNIYEYAKDDAVLVPVAPIGPKTDCPRVDVASISGFNPTIDEADRARVRRDVCAAYAAYSVLADSGHVAAQYRLGEIFEEGLGIPADKSKAISWYTRAALAGDQNSKNRLAAMK
jgi:TPR repeat protein